MVNKVYINAETELNWTDTGGTYTMDLGGLAADAVRVGAQGDLGAFPHSEWYSWRIHIDGFDTAPVVGEKVAIYLAQGRSTTDIDGDVGSSDAAGATADLPNLLGPIGFATVQTTTAADNLIASGVVRITSRYVSPVIHNDTADALLSTSDAHVFALTPIPPEVQ